MAFPTEFTVAPGGVSYGVEIYEGTEETIGFGMAVLETNQLPLTDYLEPVYQGFADNLRDTVLAQLPPGRKGRTYRRFFIGNQTVVTEPGELYPSTGS